MAEGKLCDSNELVKYKRKNKLSWGEISKATGGIPVQTLIFTAKKTNKQLKNQYRVFLRLKKIGVDLLEGNDK